MSRTKRMLLITLVLMLAASPALAVFYEIMEDRIEPGSRTGVVTIHVQDNLYARIYYLDSNGDGMYSPGDLRLRTFYFLQQQ